MGSKQHEDEQVRTAFSKGWELFREYYAKQDTEAWLNYWDSQTAVTLNTLNNLINSYQGDENSLE